MGGGPSKLNLAVKLSRLVLKQSEINKTASRTSGRPCNVLLAVLKLSGARVYASRLWWAKGKKRKQ